MCEKKKKKKSIRDKYDKMYITNLKVIISVLTDRRNSLFRL